MPAKTTKQTAARPAQKEKESAPAQDERQILYVDPGVVERDDHNARETDTEPDAELLASVKEIGVEEAVSVRPLSEGRYAAFKGWRRAQAQQAANSTAKADGRPVRKLPVIVRSDLVGQDAEAYLLSLIENKHRSNPSERENARAFERLALMKMPPEAQERAARALGLNRQGLRAAKKAAKLSDRELRRATAGGMDLEQMADLAEVASVTGAESKLERAHARDDEEGKGGRGHWDQEMARLRQEMADVKAREQVKKELKDAGIPLLREHYTYGEKDLSRPLSELTTAIGNPMSEERHRECPGHSARLDAEGNPVWHCSDPQTHKHKVRPRANAPKNPRSEEEKAAAAKVIACNKAWRAAREVRKAFVGTLAQGKQVAEPVRQFTFAAVLMNPGYFGLWASKNDRSDAAAFLGMPEERTTSADAFHEVVRRFGKAREANVLFASVAAANEYALREAKAWERLDLNQAAWLLLLEQHGYTLSEVEEEAVAPHRPAEPVTEEAGASGTPQEGGDKTGPQDERELAPVA
ncbi:MULTISPECIES: ParB N-terminal domain-containing protein [unclassified Streptomyces]|uniref:ParB/RepB/Spo0J family partition protein n=1 Tax=unclassified Streptomyces TaxID=2593676 RepID=UPI002DD9D0D4|nr:ParB N-terminal domain-containing protein [Streptomyces sp. NBC_01795]WSA97772.1 ParB N-terminal domain-containing protein [Streptomyces sp. NBC_01795]WSS46711.1 ParB N-terminal domain-containing protein [Streptomyces sp. NBC_01187]WSS47072.1 ParB N-terminal domain-containing protein [Streptomyces sp. NBC_01187]